MVEYVKLYFDEFSGNKFCVELPADIDSTGQPMQPGCV